MPSSPTMLPRLMNIPCTAWQTLKGAENDPPAQLNVLETVAHHPQGMGYGELAPDTRCQCHCKNMGPKCNNFHHQKPQSQRLTLASHIHSNMYAKAFPNTTMFPSTCTPKVTHLCPARPANPLLESQRTKTSLLGGYDFKET